MHTHVHLMPSQSTPGRRYHTSRVACSCDAFRYNRPRDPHYRCKHMRALAAKPFWCAACGQAYAAANELYCLTCLHRGTAINQRLAVNIPAFAHCCHCGQRYAWSEIRPLYCPDCEGHGWN